MKLNKTICKRCCGGELVASYDEDEQVGKPVPWRHEDEEHWKAGQVQCPHKRTETDHKGALQGCLRKGGQHAAATGALVPWDES